VTKFLNSGQTADDISVTKFLSEYDTAVSNNQSSRDNANSGHFGYGGPEHLGGAHGSPYSHAFDPRYDHEYEYDRLHSEPLPHA